MVMVPVSLNQLGAKDRNIDSGLADPVLMSMDDDAHQSTVYSAATVQHRRPPHVRSCSLS
jgi:hypothetical protein